MSNNPNYVPMTAANAPKINVGNSPGGGYKTESLLTNIVKTQASKLAKDQATKFISKKASSLVNDKLGKVGLGGGLGSSALNKATESARSASEKLSGVLGGKLSSTLGAGLSSKLGGIAGGVASGLVNKGVSALQDAGTKKLNNLVTGAQSKLSSLASDKLGSALGSALGGRANDLLSSALSGLSDNGVKNLASAKIAQGFLTNGPKAETLTEDVYGVSDNNVLNGLGEKVSGFAKDAFNDIRKAPGLVTDLTKMVMSGGKDWSVLKDGLADRVVSSLGGARGLVSNLGSTFKNSLTGGLGLPDDIYDAVVVTIGDKTSTFHGEVTGARQVFSLINQVTKSSQLSGFFDVGSESALMSSVMSEAIALGVPDAIEVLVENAKDDQIAYNALYANMRVAVENSDLDTVLLMIDKVGINTFRAQVPDAASILLSNYQLPRDTTSDDYDAELLALQAVLLKLDSNWNQVQRNGEWIQDLTPYAAISDDARTLLMRDDNFMVASLISSQFQQPTNLIDDLKKMYPLAPL